MNGPPRRLADLVGDLEVTIHDATCEAAAVAVPSYGGVRPTSTIVLRGAEREGRGEHVGWTPAAHASFRAVTAGVPSGRIRVADLSAALARRIPDPYDRAAIEAAAVDLALRQHATNLFRLADVPPRAVRYVVSVARLAEARDELARAPGIRLKIDADTHSDAATYAALTRVAILDFKGKGTAADVEHAASALPDVLLEDPPAPWPPALHPRLSLDAPIATAADVERLAFRPAAVNLKPARMGGVLEALRAAACCAERGIPVYLGGMFEIGVGRLQLRVLAACLAPDGPNDIAPIGIADVFPPRPARLDVDGDGEGFA